MHRELRHLYTILNLLFNNQNRVTGKPLCSWQNEMAPDGIEVSAESVCVR